MADPKKEQQNAIKEVAQAIADFVECSPAVLFLWRAEEGWPVEYVTPNVTYVLGYDQSDFYSADGLKYSDIVHPDDLPTLVTELDRAVETGLVGFSTDYRVKHKDGQFRWVNERTWFHRNVEGKVTHYQGVVLDITDQKMTELAIKGLQETEQELKRSETRFRELANALPHVVVEANSEGWLTWANSNGYKIFGYKPEELEQKKHIVDFISPSDRKRAEKNLRTALSGASPEPHEYLAVKHDGTEFPVLVQSNAIFRNGKPEGVITILVDISHRVEADRLKTAFLSIASHELRTPLTTIRLLIQQSQKQAGRGEQVSTKTLDRMLHQTERMAEMVNDLLDVSRLERGTLILKTAPTDLCRLVERVVEDLRSREPERRIILHLPSSPTVAKVDAARIEQVLSNLLDNAVKYSFPDSTIEVQLSADRDNKQATVSVKDQGQGIAKEHQAEVFTRFSKTTPTLRYHTMGLGLGLYISKQIIEQNGGTIGFESEPGKGSRFQFTLPLDTD